MCLAALTPGLLEGGKARGSQKTHDEYQIIVWIFKRVQLLTAPWSSALGFLIMIKTPVHGMTTQLCFQCEGSATDLTWSWFDPIYLNHMTNSLSLTACVCPAWEGVEASHGSGARPRWCGHSLLHTEYITAHPATAPLLVLRRSHPPSPPEPIPASGALRTPPRPWQRAWQPGGT